jgi:hypothetical protein
MVVVIRGPDEGQALGYVLVGSKDVLLEFTVG